MPGINLLFSWKRDVEDYNNLFSNTQPPMIYYYERKPSLDIAGFPRVSPLFRQILGLFMVH